MNRLPFLITVPHGGTRIPDFLADRIALTPKDVFDDIDACTREIYDLSELVMEWKDTDIARPVVDLNRDPQNRPPQYTDGVVKSHTCMNVPVYDPQRPIDDALTEDLLRRYYAPFHAEIESVVTSRTDLRLAFDCHTMSETAPPVAAEPGKPRPTFCLGNQYGDTCPNTVAETLARCIRKVFELEEEEVTLNEPFAGGYITKTYGNKPIPWIQIEMNRKLYLHPSWFDAERLTVDPGRLKFLRDRMREALVLFHETCDALQ